MSSKKTKQYYEDLAKNRNHVLIKLSNELTPSQGSLTLHCNDCGKDFTTSAKSYENARKTGCTSCKSIKAKNQSGYNKISKPLAPQILKPNVDAANLPLAEQIENEDETALQRAQAKTNERLLKRRSFQRDNNVYSRPDLLRFLKENPDPYHDFMLQALDNEKALLDDPVKSKTKQAHHIIPKHAGGPDAQWNLVYLTPEDHCKAHKLRYEAKGEFGDYNFLKTRGSDAMEGIAPNQEFDNQLLNQRQTANQNVRLRISDDDGSKSSRAVSEGLSEEAKQGLRERHLSQMSPEVRNVLQAGATFVHGDTGITFQLNPNQAPTLTELKDLLAAQLPKDHIDRKRLENPAKPVNVTSAISKMIKGVKDRPSAYGWRLLKNL